MEYISVLLYANNFMHMSNYLGIIMLFIYYGKKRLVLRIPMNSAFWLIVLASVSYLLIYIRNYGMPEISTMLLRYFMPPLLFYLGLVHVDGDEQRLINLSMCATYGAFIHGLLNIITNRNLEILSIAGRQYADVYGGVISGTLQNLNFVFSCSLLAYFVFCVKSRIKWLGIISVLLGVYGSVVNASRTMIFVTLIIFAAMSFSYIRMNYSFTSSLAKLGGLALALVVVALLVLWMDLFSIREWFALTALGQRQSIGIAGNTLIDNSRWEYATEILRLLPSNVWGGIEYKYYAHNLWIDVAKEAGVIPFVLYMLFFFDLWKNIIRCFRCTEISQKTRLFVLSIISSCTLTFFTEPIMQGAPLVFSLFCYICGGLFSISSMNTQAKHHYCLR